MPPLLLEKSKNPFGQFPPTPMSYPATPPSGTVASGAAVMVHPSPLASLSWDCGHQYVERNNVVAASDQWPTLAAGDDLFAQEVTSSLQEIKTHYESRAGHEYTETFSMATQAPRPTEQKALAALTSPSSTPSPATNNFFVYPGATLHVHMAEKSSEQYEHGLSTPPDSAHSNLKHSQPPTPNNDVENVEPVTRPTNQKSQDLIERDPFSCYMFFGKYPGGPEFLLKPVLLDTQAKANLIRMQDVVELGCESLIQEAPGRLISASQNEIECVGVLKLMCAAKAEQLSVKRATQTFYVVPDSNLEVKAPVLGQKAIRSHKLLVLKVQRAAFRVFGIRRVEPRERRGDQKEAQQVDQNRRDHDRDMREKALARKQYASRKREQEEQDQRDEQRRSRR